jgi:sulfite reductase (ferredoxin)
MSASPSDTDTATGAPPAPAGGPRRPAPDGRPARKPVNHGQWAAGDRTPLNANEEFKAADNGLNVRARIEDVYSQQGFASIPADDLRGRFRWYGLYTQRRPGIPGGATATLPPEELDDEFFMLRVRSDAGALTSEQARVIGRISTELARDTADISDRQNIQLHWVRIEDVPLIWERLEAVGLGTTEACGDTPRVVLGSPVAGRAADEVVDGTAAIDEIVRRYLGDPEYANLPRKFKSAVSGSPHQDVAHEVNDLSFVGAVHPEHGPGFDVWVGGGLSTNPRLAVRLGVWVPPQEVPDVWEAVVALFRDHGYRRLRTKARLKHLVADWGPQRLRAVLETDYLKRPLIDGPEPPQARGARDHVGVHEQRDGLCYVGAAPTVGRVSGTILQRVADLAEEHGSGQIRLTAQQKLVILDVPRERTGALTAELESLGLRTRPSVYRRSAMACTGIEFCKLAIAETKGLAARLVDELERRVPEMDQPIAIHVNGCPNSCARFQVADIGLKGVLAPGQDGEQVEAFQVHLGGSLGERSAFGETVRGHRVPADELPDYVERLLRRYLAGRRDGESFAEWAVRADDEEVR